MEKIWVSLHEWANSTLKSLNVRRKEYLESAKQFLYNIWERMKSWYSPKKGENSQSPNQHEDENVKMWDITVTLVRSKINDYLKSASDYFESFSRELKSWLRLPNISIQEFFLKKKQQFLDLARSFFNNLSNIINQRFDFLLRHKAKVDGFVQKYLNLATSFFKSISDTFKQSFDKVKVCIHELVQKLLGSTSTTSSSSSSSRVKICFVFLKFIPHLIELIKKLNNTEQYRGAEFDMKEMIVLLCEFLDIYMQMQDEGNNANSVERLVIEAIKFFVKKLYKGNFEEFEDVTNMLCDFLHHMKDNMFDLSQVAFRFLIHAIKYYYKE